MTFTTLIFLLFIKGTVILLLDQLISSSLLCCWFLVSCEVVIEFEVIGPTVSIGVISSYFFLGDIISQLLLKKLWLNFSLCVNWNNQSIKEFCFIELYIDLVKQPVFWKFVIVFLIFQLLFFLLALTIFELCGFYW